MRARSGVSLTIPSSGFRIEDEMATSRGVPSAFLSVVLQAQSLWLLELQRVVTYGDFIPKRTATGS